MSGPGDLPPLENTRWCFDTKDAQGSPCAIYSDGCTFSPRTCRLSELVAGQGWDAGAGPDPAATDTAVTTPGPDFCPAGFEPDPDSDETELVPCRPSPGDCGLDEFALTEADDVRFVDDDAAPNGDGTLAAPYQTIQKAINSSAPGMRIAVAAGEYSGHLLIPWPLDIVGRCAAQVRFTGTSGTSSIEVPKGAPITGESALLRGITVTGDRLGIMVEGGVPLRIERVHIDAAQTVGAHAAGAKAVLHVHDSVVSNTQPNATGLFGQGVQIIDGAVGRLRSVRLTGNHARGLVIAGDGTSGEALNMLIDRTRYEQATQEAGYGVQVTDESSLVLAPARIHRSAGAGAMVAFNGTLQTAGLLIDQSVGENAGLADGLGITVQSNGSLTLVAARLTQNGGRGLELTSGATATVRGALIDGNGGLGIHVSDATLRLRGGRSSANVRSGLCSNSGAVVRIAGFLSDGTQPDSKKTAVGICAHDNVDMEAFGVRVRGTVGAGMLVDHAPSHLLAGGLLIQDTAFDGTFGRGLQIGNGATAALVAVQIDNSAGIGLSNLGEGTVIDAVGLIIDHSGFHGAQMGHGAKVTIREGIVRNSHATGFLIGGNSSEVTLEGVLIEGTELDEGTQTGGQGVQVYDQVASRAPTRRPCPPTFRAPTSTCLWW